MGKLQQRCEENPILASAFEKVSSDCKDLLWQIFEPVDSKRITLDGIQKHPWYVKPLTPRFAAAREEMQQQQAVLTASLAQTTLDEVCCWCVCVCVYVFTQAPHDGLYHVNNTGMRSQSQCPDCQAGAVGNTHSRAGGWGQLYAHQFDAL